MVTATRRIAPQTPQRWHAALERAMDQGVIVRFEAASGRAIATSGTKGATCYEVGPASCSCPAGLAGDICKHRAYFLYSVGLLPIGNTPATDPTPDPEPAAATIEPRRCLNCHGGYNASVLTGWDAIKCHTCNGVGWILPAGEAIAA